METEITKRLRTKLDGEIVNLKLAIRDRIRSAYRLLEESERELVECDDSDCATLGINLGRSAAEIARFSGEVKVAKETYKQIKLLEAFSGPRMVCKNTSMVAE